MIQTAIWVPPTLCGCQLRITADWCDGSIIDGVSYQHPKQFTITDIQVESVCSEHEEIIEMPDTSQFFDGDIQNRGYLKYPINNPTRAHMIYTELYDYTLLLGYLRCGCKISNCVHRHTGEGSFKDHPQHTKKCIHHVEDTIDGAQAVAEHDCEDELNIAIKKNHSEIEQWRPFDGDDSSWQPLSSLTPDLIVNSYLNEKRGLGPLFVTEWLFKTEFDDQRKLKVYLHPSVKDVSERSVLSTIDAMSSVVTIEVV